jgi:signal transduction histidine kinase
MQAPLPVNETTRLEALRDFDVLDTPPEQAFDDLTMLASQICNTPVAMVSLVDGDRQWFKSKVGTEATETPRDVAFCAHAILEPDLFIIPDAEADERFVGNPLLTSEPHIRFYAGAPLITPDGHAIGTLCTIDRVSRQLSPEQTDALRALARQAMTQFELRRNLKKLQELEKLREGLTSMIVHDLRTPLTSLLGGLLSMEMLGELNADQRELLKMSIHGGQTLLGMINDLLDISKMEDGSLKLERARVRVEELVDQALQQVTRLAAQKEIALVREIEPDLPALYADEAKLVRTLVNLLGNALKFTPPGGRVTLAARRSGTEQAVEFSVTDTGEGIPAEAFEQIFEKFGQVESRQAGRKMSTGLGLTFCKMAVEEHGGRIWVESELGRGSTFRFVVPLGAATSEATEVASI